MLRKKDTAATATTPKEGTPLAQEDAPKKSERILTFDLLRGYFLFVILLNHLQYYPSGFDILTGRSALYASTAEGFFVISGLVLGIVRGRKLLSKPFSVAAKLLLKRSVQLYITSILLTFLFTIVGSFFLSNAGLKTTIYPDLHNWWALIVDTITLQYTYGWADFLRLYALFIFFSPIALWLLRKGLWYVVLSLSIGAWLLYPTVSMHPVLGTYAHPISWQLIFFSGFIIGFYWEPLLAKWRSLSIQLRKAIGWSVVTVFAITLITSFILVFGHYLGGSTGKSLDNMHHIVREYFDKNRLPLARIALGTVWLWGLFYLVRRFESTIKKYLGWFLLEWGTNSLYVYTISAFVLFFIHLVIPPASFRVLGSIPINFVLSVAVIAIVHLALKKKFLAKIIPR